MTLIRHFVAASALLLAATLHANDVSVTIRLRPATDGYVALVPMWRPAARPLAVTPTCVARRCPTAPRCGMECGFPQVVDFTDAQEFNHGRP